MRVLVKENGQPAGWSGEEGKESAFYFWKSFL